MGEREREDIFFTNLKDIKDCMIFSNKSPTFSYIWCILSCNVGSKEKNAIKITCQQHIVREEAEL